MPRRPRTSRARPAPGARRWWLPVLVAAAVVLGSLGSLTALAVERSASAVTGQVEGRAQDATAAARAFVRARVGLLEQLVSSYATQPQLQAAVASGAGQAGPSALTASLRQLQQSAPGLVAAWVADADGVILTTDAGASPTVGQDLSYRDWYRGARGSDEPYLSPGYVNRDAARTAGFAVSIAVRGPGGPDAPVVGVLGTSMSLDAFAGVFSDAAPAGGKMVVTDQDGQVLVAPGAAQPVLTDASADPGVREAIAGRTTLHRVGDFVQVHAPLGRGWTVGTSLPAALADRPNAQLAGALTAAGAVAALCLLGAVLLLARVLRSRTRAETALAAALEEVERRGRYTDAVLDTLEVSVVVCDRTGALTYFNRLGRAWHGLDALEPDAGPETWSTRYATTHTDGSPVAAADWPLVRAVATRAPASAELLLSTDGQQPRRILVLARPLLDVDGSVLGAVSGSHDVTAIRAQETELEQARDTAVQASGAKSSFLAAMSHEIRTPLNGVLGMLDLVLYDTTLPRTVRDRLEVAASSGQTLLRLLNDVLDLSRADAVRLTLQRRPTDLRELVRSAAAVLSGPAQAKGLALDVVLDDDLPERTSTDPDRLTQVLLNLIGNAVKFTSTGSVTVSAGVGAGSPAQLVLRVVDTGPGMTPDEAQRVFRPFEQGAAGCAHGGTGLGLALTSQLVELFGGTVTVQSEPGRGSTFTVTLPLELCPALPAAAPVPASRRPVDGDLPPLHLLVAEDNPVNQLVLQATLDAVGVTVDLVDDGAQAVERVLGGGRYDAVLLDWQMPVLDGLATASALRAAGVSLPLIGLTARTSADDVRACLAAGMDRVLPKPCPMPDLVQALRELGGQSSTAVASTSTSTSGSNR